MKYIRVINCKQTKNKKYIGQIGQLIKKGTLKDKITECYYVKMADGKRLAILLDDGFIMKNTKNILLMVA